MLANIVKLLFILAVVKTVKYGVTVEENYAIKRASTTYEKLTEKLGIQCPRVVVAQICLETNYLTSRIYKENNNLFGMKESSRNWDVGSNLGHAKYISPAHSLLDYRDWQKQMARGRVFKTDEEYIQFLGCLFKDKNGCVRYAEDKEYEKKLTNIITKL